MITNNWKEEKAKDACSVFSDSALGTSIITGTTEKSELKLCEVILSHNE